MLTLYNSIHSGKNMWHIYIRMQMEHKPFMSHHICSFGRGNWSWKPAKDQINTVLQFIWIKLEAPWQYAILCFLFKNYKLMQRFYLWKKKQKKKTKKKQQQQQTDKNKQNDRNVIERCAPSCLREKANKKI